MVSSLSSLDNTNGQKSDPYEAREVRQASEELVEDSAWQSMEDYMGFPDTPLILKGESEVLLALKGDSNTMTTISASSSAEFGWFSHNQSFENVGMFRQQGDDVCTLVEPSGNISAVTTMESVSCRTSRDTSEVSPTWLRGVSPQSRGLAEGSASAREGIEARTLRYRRWGDRMSEINQWHYLYPLVSSSGTLAVAQRYYASMHLRRHHFPLSTRHFPIRRTDTGRFDPQSTLGGSNSDRDSRSNGLTPPNNLGVGAAVGRVESGGSGRRKSTKSFAWALTEIRVVSGGPLWVPPHAEYLVVACLGGSRLVAGWRRSTDFARLAAHARKNWMPKACMIWEALQQARRIECCGGGHSGCDVFRLFQRRRLGEAYLKNKARFLEEFLKHFVFEAPVEYALVAFLDGGSTAEL
ncbi:unnamed protein product [Choristocarpus tenellus]